MAITTTNAPGIKPYTVLRAICMAGERVEVGDSVELTITQYTELAAAGKVGPFVEKPKAKKAKPEAPAAAPTPEAQPEADSASAPASTPEEPAP